MKDIESQNAKANPDMLKKREFLLEKREVNIDEDKTTQKKRPGKQPHDAVP
jgi:hypothetical protein